MEIKYLNGPLGKIAYVLNEPENHDDEIVIVIHGFSSFGTKELGGAPYVARELGYVSKSSIRLDLDNRGNSELDFYNASIPNYIKQVDCVVEHCKSLGYSKISIVGTSFGGITALGYFLDNPSKIYRMCLRAPVLDFYKLAQNRHKNFEELREQGYFEFHSYKDDKMIKVDFNCIESSKNYSMYERAKEVTCPLMIIHGTSDDVVPIEPAKELINSFPNAELKIIDGANHDLGVSGVYSVGMNYIKEFFSK